MIFISAMFAITATEALAVELVMLAMSNTAAEQLLLSRMIGCSISVSAVSWAIFLSEVLK